MDDLERRLHSLAESVGASEPPRDLTRRVRRRRRAGTARRTAGGLAVAALVVAGVVAVGQAGTPEVPPADPLTVTEACSPDDLLREPPTLVPGQDAAQRFTVTLDRATPSSCTLRGFRLEAADGTERARADLTDADLDPGSRVDLVVRWDPTAACGTTPVQVVAGGVELGAIALPVCGDVSVGADVSPQDASVEGWRPNA